MQSVPQYSITFSLIGAREGKWQRQSECLAAAIYRLNLSCRGYAFIARVEELEMNVCIYFGGRRIINGE